MNVAVRTRMTLEEFLAWERPQERKWEFDGRSPVEMPGGTHNHAVLQGNLNYSLVGLLRGSACRFLGSEMKLLAANRIRYPDGMILCTPVPGKALMVEAPVVVFEILSDSTQSIDRVDKNAEYRAVPSIQRYVMLEQDRIAATVFQRIGAHWLGHLLTAGDTLSLPEAAIDLPLAALYEGVELPPIPA